MTLERIVYAIDGLGAGGTERQLLYLLSNLDRARFDPYVLTLFDERAVTYHYAADLNALDIPISTLGRENGGYGRVFAMLRYIGYMWRIRPRIVQGCVHDTNLIVRVARPFCPPHILVTSERLAFSPRGIRSEMLTGWLDDYLVMNSPHILKQVEDHTHRPAHKMGVIPNAISLERFALNTHVGLRQESFPDSWFVMGFIGRIARQKDHPTLLRSLHLSRMKWPVGLKVFFLGDSSEPGAQAQITKLVGDYNLKDIIHQIPVTADVAPFYHAADVMLLPSLFEGFPNVVLEAFAAGKPVIISSDANAAGLVEPGVTGWQFPTGDAAALSDCLQAAWQTRPETLAAMGTQARKIAAQYTIPTLAQNYMNLYDSLIHKR